MSHRAGFAALALAVLVVPRLAGQSFACADTTRSALGAFAGEWTVEASFRVDSGRYENTSAHSSIVPELGGCVLAEHFRGRRYGSPYDFLAVWGANGGSPRIQRTFVHSQHGLLNTWAGDFQGDSLILGDSVTVRGQMVYERHVFSRPSADRFAFESRRSTNRGRTWTITWRAAYRKDGSRD